MTPEARTVHEQDAASERAVSNAAVVSLSVGCAVLALKLVAWRLTGSVALYSDALESIVNVVAAATMLWAVRYARMPADENHPFGHGKAEYLSAVLEGALVIVAAVATLTAAVPALGRPRPIETVGVGALVSAAASVANAALSVHLKRQGKRHRSLALEADAAHVMSDVLTSMGVLAGVAMAKLTGWWRLDALLATAVAVHILWVGAKLLRRSIGGLMDELMDPDESAALLRVAREVALQGGGIDVRKLRLRPMGHRAFCDLELVVPESMTVRTAHDLCDAVELALHRELPGTEVVVHVAHAAGEPAVSVSTSAAATPSATEQGSRR